MSTLIIFSILGLLALDITLTIETLDETQHHRDSALLISNGTGSIE
jgi:hypothetical protein